MRGADGRLTLAAEKLLNENLHVAATAESAAKGAHAIAVLTEWDEFKTADFAAIYQQMHKPAFIFDGRNLLKKNHLAELGFQYRGIGV
jgi:UDPglucose 6-dehydrogenase